MKIIRGTKNISDLIPYPVVAIGNFDGVHKGHQKVFKQAKKYSKKNKIKFGVLTFTPLPVMFFNNKIKTIILINTAVNFFND